ncbi:MAG: mismatch-specific DNA-glycosylase, partial [Chloroflexi bacterium]|nr:mismatch-specific DNA-glycosylase [Chloroflexota bacterium]
LKAADYRRWAPILKTKLLDCQPMIACFHGMMAYKAYLRYAEGIRADPELGLQDYAIGDTRVFVAPNPSPANARYSLEVLADWYRRLGSLRGELKG